MTNYGKFCRTQLIFRFQIADSPLHPEIGESVIAKFRDPEYSRVSLWKSIQNAVETRPGIKQTDFSKGLSDDQIVAELKQEVEILFDDPRESFHTLILRTNGLDDGHVINVIYQSYVDLLKVEEIRIWEEQIAELEENVRFFEAALNKPASGSSSAVRDVTEESLQNDQRLLVGLKAGFDKKVSSLEFAIFELPEPEFEYGKLLGWWFVPVLVPVLISVLIFVIMNRHDVKMDLVPDDTADSTTSKSKGYSVSAGLLLSGFALAFALVPWFMQTPKYECSARIRLKAKGSPFLTPLENFKNMQDFLSLQPIKKDTLSQFLSDNKWVTSLDQYSEFKVDPDKTSLSAFNQDPELALEKVLSDNLEWKADKLGAGFFDVSFSSIEPNDTTLILSILIVTFRKRYETAFDVFYVTEPPKKAKKVLSFPVWRMVIFGAIGFVAGCFLLFAMRVFQKPKSVQN